MKKYLLSLICPLFVLGVLIFHYCSDLNTFRSTEMLLLPVRIEEIKTNDFFSVAKIRYYNIIPVDEMIKESGKIVVTRSDNGRVSFVSNFTGQNLRPREMLLKYTIIPPSLMKQEKRRLNIRFAATELRFAKESSLLPTTAYYAVVRVNDSGDASLIGLTDSSGTQVVKSLLF